MEISRKHFGITPDGRAVGLYTLTNDHGMEVTITNFGGAITSLKVPDRSDEPRDVVLGYETLDDYVKQPRFLGALIGRFANRIAKGRFALNGIAYQLAQNNGDNHLHGGRRGFDKVVWEAQDALSEDSAALHLTYLSKDGEENYPGNLKAEVHYVLRGNELRLEYHASTDKDTIVNLTNHSYFNLAGAGNILNHELTIEADEFTPVGPDLIPTGEIRRVEDTPHDFRQGTAIGGRIEDPDEQLTFAGGYDHNFVLRDFDGLLRKAATIHEQSSGLTMQVLTTQPGLQFYSGNFLDGSLTGKAGVVYHKYAGLCLETQHFPDSPNHPHFPSTQLRPGEELKETTVLHFSAQCCREIATHFGKGKNSTPSIAGREGWLAPAQL